MFGCRPMVGWSPEVAEPAAVGRQGGGEAGVHVVGQVPLGAEPLEVGRHPRVQRQEP
jgi:hypothetical protein